MVGILKHAGREIGANGKKVNAGKCAKMVKFVNGKTSRGGKW